MNSSLLLFCVCSLGFAAASVSLLHALVNPKHHFEQFIQEHGKKYADEHEKQTRFEIFVENLKAALHLNKKHGHDIYGITKFMDLTEEEFVNSYTGLKFSPYVDDITCKKIYDKNIPDVDAPESFDWRDHNVVSPVKDQKDCGSCWAFSATGSIESNYAIKYKQPPPVLSEQQLVDCDKNSLGCSGGIMSSAFTSILEMGGIESEEDYPYKAIDDKCQFDAKKAKVKLAECFVYDLSSQEKVKQLLYKTGPVSIAIAAGQKFSMYKEGIIPDQDCGGQLNHGVLLVGYGANATGHKYWIVKNSWGSWGDGGYFKLERGEDRSSCEMVNIAMATAAVQ